MHKLFEHWEIKNVGAGYFDKTIVALFLFSKFKNMIAVKNIMSCLLLSLISGFAFSQAGCPTISITVSNGSVKEGTALEFTASVKGDGNFTYNWSVSSGTIESGQGTAFITVNTNGLANQSVTATIDLGGADRSCSTTKSYTASVSPNPKAKVLVIENFTNIKTLAEWINQTVINLNLTGNDSYSGSKAFIYLYPGPNTKPAELNAKKEDIVKVFDKNKVLSLMYKIVVAGKHKKAGFEIWELPAGADEPTATVE
ncbi:MAG: hypothetical protein ABJA78_00260 [Ferruginibacter sp.]